MYFYRVLLDRVYFRFIFFFDIKRVVLFERGLLYRSCIGEGGYRDRVFIDLYN